MTKCSFFAMTASELRENPDFPDRIGWMACHFSPYSRALSNLPTALPPDSLLLLDDSAPIQGHDPEIISQQLCQIFQQFACRGVLLDLERSGCPETERFVQYLVQHLPYPVIVSQSYAQALPCPVFLPPLPPDILLEDYIRPWQGREIWLEAALNALQITLTEQGASSLPVDDTQIQTQGLPEEALHCHYSICMRDEDAVFTLWRTNEDLQSLLEEAHTLDITTVGLFQELRA